jgi:aspartate/methionine/tyrosine aminotransferase
VTDFQPFAMERMMSRFEQVVEFNLSESGVHPMRLEELLATRPGAREDLLGTEIHYPHTNGIPPLRDHIAAMYPGATPDNVLVTVGAIEANYVALRSLVAPGEGIVVMMPNYLQIWGIARNHGLAMETFRLREDQGWAPDLDELRAAIGPATRLIAVCNPNNPTGRAMTEAEMDAVVAAADRVGAWILADEVYAGAERTTDAITPSFWGRYDKVVAVGSMSKAYGLPGLRLGWAVAPVDAIGSFWARHDYVALSATMLSNKLAAIALDPAVRPQILERTRGFIRRGFPVLQRWLAAHPGLLDLQPPDAAAIACLRHHLPVESTALVERLLRDASVLIVPGDHFGLDRHLRISFGLPEDYLAAGLERIHRVLSALAANERQGLEAESR